MRTISPSYTLKALNRATIERITIAAGTVCADWAQDRETQHLFSDLRKKICLGRQPAALNFLRSLEQDAPSGIVRAINCTIMAYVTTHAKAPIIPLAGELRRIFLQDLVEYATRKPARRRDRVESTVPKPVLFCDPRDGVSKADIAREAKETLRTFLTAREQYDRACRGNGRASVAKKASVERNAVWWYRYVLKDVPISQLAREYCADCKKDGTHISNDGHEIVRQGIDATAELFDVPAPRR